MRHAVLAILPICATAMLLSGCGPGRGDISGVVQFKNKPLQGGSITFYDEHNGVHTGEIKSDGAYIVTGVATGNAKIAVTTPMAISMPGAPAVKTTPIPAKYADREKSGLTYQVKSGSQTHPIVLVE